MVWNKLVGSPRENVRLPQQTMASTGARRSITIMPSARFNRADWGWNMPKIDISAVPALKGVSYPQTFAMLSANRLRQKLGDAGGLTDFGVNLTRLPPGEWSSQRHWHSHEDEFVFLLQGELALIEDDAEILLRAGDAAAFPKGTGNGHHMVNRSDRDAIYLEVGSRKLEDVTTCSDVDMVSANADGRFVHKDGTPYS